MLTAPELLEIRATSEDNLPDLCAEVDLSTSTRDAYGDVTEGAVTGPDFACRVRPIATGSRQSDAEGVILERLGVIEAWMITASRSVEIELEDRIMVDVQGHVRLLEVVAAPGPKSYEAIHRFVATESK